MKKAFKKTGLSCTCKTVWETQQRQREPGKRERKRERERGGGGSQVMTTTGSSLDNHMSGLLSVNSSEHHRTIIPWGFILKSIEENLPVSIATGKDCSHAQGAGSGTILEG